MKRPFVVIGGGFLSGAFIASNIGINEHMAIIAICSFVCLFTLIIMKFSYKVPLVVFLALFVVGMATYSQSERIYSEKSFIKDSDGAYIEGEVSDIIKSSAGKRTYIILVDSINGESVEPFLMNLYSGYNREVDYYDEVNFYADVIVPTPSATFDSYNYYKSKGVYLLGFLSDEVDMNITSFGVDSQSLMYKIKTLNDDLSSEIDKYFDQKQAVVMKNLLLSTDDYDETNLDISYDKTGLSHLFSISGLHLSILFSFVYFIFTKLGLSKRYSSIAAMGFILFFVAFTGFNIPTIRAGIMVGMLLLGNVFRLKSDSVNSLFIAGVLIVATNIFSIRDVGFIMSFLSVGAIIILHPIISEYVISKNKLKSDFAQKIVSLSCVSIAATIGILPVYIIIFKSMSTIFLISNLIVLPVSTIVLCLGFVFLIIVNFGAIDSITRILSEITAGFIDLQNHLVEVFADFELAVMGLDNEMFFAWYLASVALLILSYVLRKRVKLLKASIVAICAVALFITPYTLFASKGEISLHTITDGNRTNIAITYANSATVILGSDNNYIDELTLNKLNAMGITKIDNLVIAYDEFEAYNDTEILAENIAVDNVFINKYNTFAKVIVPDFDVGANIYEIDDMTINIKDNLSINFYYDRKSLITSINTDVFGGCISAYYSIPQTEEYNIFCISGQTWGEQVDIPMGQAVILDRQYDEIRVNSEYVYAIDGDLKLVISGGR